MSAVSSTDVWAVGWYQRQLGQWRTFTLHWDGSSWSKIRSPSPGLGAGSSLWGVSAISSNDVWAVGRFQPSWESATLTLMLHWNGSRWSKVWSPNGHDAYASELQDVSAVSSTDVWAVGWTLRTSGRQFSLTLHWDGARWSRIWSPTAPDGSLSILWGVSAISSIDVWAVGAHSQRWDGTRWSPVSIPYGPVFLFGVSATSPSDAWAVGRSWVLHWNGTGWSAVWTDPSTFGPMGVSALSPIDVWAVGTEVIPYRAERTMIIHWGGTTWTRT